MTNLKGKSFEFLMGYHAAMLAIATDCLDLTDRALGEINRVPLTFFGKERPDHHFENGRVSASKEISANAAARANEAFLPRRLAK